MIKQCCYGREVIDRYEIVENDFVHSSTPANVTASNEPYVTLTYDLGVYPNYDHQDIPKNLKKNIIHRIKSIGITHVHAVYFGEIFIDPNYIGLDGKNRWNHIFVRGYRERQKLSN